MIPDRWLFPHDPRFRVADWLAAHSPRAWDTPDFARWVQEASAVNNISAQWLLMTAEKEQSFLTREAGGKGWQRALDYTMGYGATDSHDIPKYKGTEQQVRSAANGLRGYLTPSHSLYVGKLVGKPYRCSDGYYTPTTLAEAAQLQYTPWVKYLKDTVKVWEALFGKETTMPQNPADIAEAIVAARLRGDTLATKNGVQFKTNEKGYCSRFVRLCHKSAGLPTSVFGCCAHETYRRLEAAHKRVQGSVRGGIIVFSNSGPKCSTCGTNVWHIAVDLGNGYIAENTSSSTRGNPKAAGTKKTPLASIGTSRIVGRYSLL
jgi:hypothetical protein